MPSEFDAVVVASSAHANVNLLGLTLVERGRRVAGRAGARRVYVVDSAEAAVGLARWDEERGDAALMVLRAGDQVVHRPLVDPLLAGSRDRRIAVTPDGSYAGALWVHGAIAREVIAAIAASPADGDRKIVARWGEMEKIPHGDIARHPATTPEERAGARAMLLRLNIKKEDNPVTRYLYRPLSGPLTRLLLHTPITPNQVSILVGILGLIGCWLTALPGQTMLIWGAAIIFFASVLDGCDGEIARLRLISSPLGAWLDTIVDEMTTTVYFVAIGYHTYLHRPDGWVMPSIVIGTLAYVGAIYAIYFFCIVVIKKGGSQFYLGTLEIVDGATGPALRAKPRSPSITSPFMRNVGVALLTIKTRDFVNIAALLLTLVDAYLVIYVGMLIGGVITAIVIIPEHIKLRLQLRELARRGGTPRLIPS